MKRRQFWPALLALLAAPKALMASKPETPATSGEYTLGTSRPWFCVLCRREVVPVGQALWVTRGTKIERQPDECPHCGCGLFVQAKHVPFEIKT